MDDYAIIRMVQTRELYRIATMYPFSLFTVAYLKFNFNLTDHGVECVLIRAIETGSVPTSDFIIKEIYDNH